VELAHLDYRLQERVLQMIITLEQGVEVVEISVHETVDEGLLVLGNLFVEVLIVLGAGLLELLLGAVGLVVAVFQGTEFLKVSVLELLGPVDVFADEGVASRQSQL